MREAPLLAATDPCRVRPFAAGQSGMVTQAKWLTARLLSGSGVMGSELVVNRPREAESLGVGPDRDVDLLEALGAEESESHADQVDDPARRGKVL
jgi:hypothetical protein